jgi:hypothetical protein
VALRHEGDDDEVRWRWWRWHSSSGFLGGRHGRAKQPKLNFGRAPQEWCKK